MVGRLAVALALLGAVACSISIDVDGTRFRCDDGVCPQGFDCLEGFCEERSTTVGDRIHPIVIDHTGSETLTSFPLLVTLESAAIDLAGLEPADLHFRGSDDATLAHQIERWNPSGDSLVWVLVPTVAPMTSTPQLFLELEDGAGAVEAPEQLWADFQALYHLEDLTDEASSGFDGTDVGSVVDVGVIGNGRRFSGGTYVDLGRERPFLRAEPRASISAWIKLDPTISETGTIFATSIDNGGVTSNASRFQMLTGPAGELRGSARSDDMGPIQEVEGPAVPTGVWTHVAFSCEYATGTMKLYIDGAEVASAVAPELMPTSPDSVSTQTTIGFGDGLVIDPFEGVIDEVRLRTDIPSATWFAAERRSALGEMAIIGPAE